MAKFESVSELIESYKTRFISENAEGVDTIVQLNFNDAPGDSFFVMIKDNQCVIERGVHQAPELTVHTSIQDWLKLNNGKANPMMMMMQGKLKVDGPMSMASKFQAMFKDSRA